MRQRILLLCTALSVCLVLNFLFFEKETNPFYEIKGKGPHKVFALDRDEISEVLIMGGTNLRLGREGRFWWIMEPKLLMADQEEVDRLISGFAGLCAERVFRAEKGLDEFGLGTPALIISVHTPRGWYNLAIGDESPTSSFCYGIIPGGNNVMLLPIQMKQVLGRDLSGLRERHLVRIVPERIRRLRVVSPRILLDIEKDRSGDWHFSGNEGVRLKAELVNGFIARLADTEAVKFPDEQIVSGEPGTVIELDSSGRTFRIELWKLGKRTLCISNIQKENVEIDGAPLLQAMPSDPDAIVDKRIVDLREYDLRRIGITGFSGRVFTKQQDGWYADGRKLRRPEQLTSFVDLLAGVERKDEYLVLPTGLRKEREININKGTSSPGFDIILYSQYYVKVRARIFRINEGDMRGLEASINSLLEEKR